MIYYARREDVEVEGQRRRARTRSSTAYGADAVRLYILFMGPADQDVEWQDTGIEGIVRASCGGSGGRSLEVAEREPAVSPEATPLVRKAHADDRQGHRRHRPALRFNTPIAAVMELVNEINRASGRPGRALRRRDRGQPDPALRAARRRGAVAAARARAPLAAALARASTRRCSSSETFELVVQVNGKVRDRIEVSVAASEEELVELARSSPRVAALIEGKEVRKTIVVPRKLVNLVI